MTEYIKPKHHKINVQKLREWRTRTDTDREQSICIYCDEGFVRTKNLRCSLSCGTHSVWVDTPTLARINLEEIYV
jgi:hypothetical protein